MAIYRFLQNSGFDPEDVIRMATAYELALSRLGLKDRDDPLTETVARIVIDVAQGEAQEPKSICDMALNRLDAARSLQNSVNDTPRPLGSGIQQPQHQQQQQEQPDGDGDRNDDGTA